MMVPGVLFGQILSAYDANIDSFTRRLGTLIGAADSYTALLWSSLASLFVAMMLTMSQKIMNLKDTVETAIGGFKTMVPALMILILAWSLAMVTDEMHTADFITQVFEQNSIPYWSSSSNHIYLGRFCCLFYRFILVNYGIGLPNYFTSSLGIVHSKRV